MADFNVCIKQYGELKAVGLSDEKIARILFGDAHPMCMVLVEACEEANERTGVQMFFDDLFNYQEQFDWSNWLANKVEPLVGDELEGEEEELIELCGSCDDSVDMECTNCGVCLNL